MPRERDEAASVTKAQRDTERRRRKELNTQGTHSEFLSLAKAAQRRSRNSRKALR